KPMYITENGMGCYEDISKDVIDDEERIRYIREHVRWLLKAKEENYDINGYFVWSPFDLYSWKNGTEKRYGLVAVDFQNGCRRRPKKSYYWYRDGIKNNWEELKC
ncbi:MAG: glycoside hydrolase family 1 protein, partial [Erysipelotrichaceae bacterium]|nr:glycoside hydrolase family 1 protein [Erysipelotrichaceae bacterium]